MPTFFQSSLCQRARLQSVKKIRIQDPDFGDAIDRQAIALGHRADGLPKLLQVGELEDEAARPQLERAIHVVLLAVHGEHDDPRGGPLGQQLTGLLGEAVLDENDTVKYSQLVPEIKNEPDYDAALAALK